MRSGCQGGGRDERRPERVEQGGCVGGGAGRQVADERRTGRRLHLRPGESLDQCDGIAAAVAPEEDQTASVGGGGVTEVAGAVILVVVYERARRAAGM